MVLIFLFAINQHHLKSTYVHYAYVYVIHILNYYVLCITTGCECAVCPVRAINVALASQLNMRTRRNSETGNNKLQQYVIKCIKLIIELNVRNQTSTIDNVAIDRRRTARTASNTLFLHSTHFYFFSRTTYSFMLKIYQVHIM